MLISKAHLFLITYMHEDYYKPTDRVEKLVPEKLAYIAHVISGGRWQIANMEGRPELIELE